MLLFNFTVEDERLSRIIWSSLYIPRERSYINNTAHHILTVRPSKNHNQNVLHKSIKGDEHPSVMTTRFIIQEEQDAAALLLSPDSKTSVPSPSMPASKALAFLTRVRDVALRDATCFRDGGREQIVHDTVIVIVILLFAALLFRVFCVGVMAMTRPFPGRFRAPRVPLVPGQAGYYAEQLKENLLVFAVTRVYDDVPYNQDTGDVHPDFVRNRLDSFAGMHDVLKRFDRVMMATARQE